MLIFQKPLRFRLGFAQPETMYTDVKLFSAYMFKDSATKCFTNYLHAQKSFFLRRVYIDFHEYDLSIYHCSHDHLSINFSLFWYVIMPVLV